MAVWHHQLNGHKFEQAPVVGDGQGSLVCGSPWGCKESDATGATQHSQAKEQKQNKQMELHKT